ncbi:MAG: RND family transporter [Mycobacterium sp.]
MDTTDVAAGGIFRRLGDFVARWPLFVIGFWIALAAVLALTLPPLPEIAAQKQLPPLPDDAPTMVIARAMNNAFHETGSGSQIMVVLTNESGLGPADEATYRTLIDKLRQDTQDKMAVQDFISAPPMREVLASKDNKAWNVPINLPGNVGAPETLAAYQHVYDIVKKTLAGSTLTAHFAGGVVTTADITMLGMHDMHVIEIGTGVLVLLILLAIYRNLVTMLVPLATIGLSLVTAQGTLAGLAEIGLPIGIQTLVLLVGVMVGAGVDYAVFLISRYHDYVRRGEDSDQAVKYALMSIGKVIAASAATVAITFLAMVFAKLGVFSTVGPAISISVIVAFLAAVTLLPAILMLAGRRGWIKPRRDLTTRFWRRTGTRVVRRPRIHLVASGIVLIILASCVSLARFDYDDIGSLPNSAASVDGFAALDRHFPTNALTPEMLLITSPKDLRTPAALADLEQMAQRVSQVHDITMVRGLTRPNGGPLEQTKVSYQAGEVGGKLDEASSVIHDHGGDMDKLANGANQLADALAQVRGQVNGAVGSVSTLVTALSAMEAAMGGDKTLNQLDQTAKLVGRMRALGDALSANMADVANTAAWATPMLTALNASPVCSTDPACSSSRAELQGLVAAQSNGTLNSLADLARNLQSTRDMQTIDFTLGRLQQSLNQAVAAVRSTNGLQSRVAQLQQGANALADGSRAIADGVQQLVNQTKKLGSGLNEASSFLLGMKRDAEKPSMAGFNIPPQVLTADEFKKAAQIFVSPDGHAARYFVQSALQPFTTAAMDQVNEIVAAAQSAQPNTELSNATISMAGIPTGLRDTRDYYNDDVLFIIFTTITIVFLILVVLLRAIVAPLYLIGSVLISFLSALGIGVIVFQLILGKELHWSLPGLTFILLVAVGADYNMLLISRIRDESPHGVRVGVIRTVGSTGGVITSAGLIFAASMFGLLPASISTMSEAGFIIGIGIVLDTFLVRTITVPALAALIGQANWWPSRLGQSPNRPLSAREPTRKGRLPASIVRLKDVFGRKAGFAVPPPPTPSQAPLHPLHKGYGTHELLGDHALPLFSLGASLDRVPGRLTNARKQATVSSTTNGNGNRPVDDLPVHALPLFGAKGLNFPTTINGNGHAMRSIDDLTTHALPLFNLDCLPTPSNGNGNGKRLVDDPKELTDTSGVS